MFTFSSISYYTQWRQFREAVYKNDFITRNYVNVTERSLTQDCRKLQPYLPYTGCSQMNGAVSKVNKKSISHLTRAKRTTSAAATVSVSHVLITILQCVHLGSQDTHPHGNQIHPRLGVACPW